jgi:hypothetical protein
MDFQNLNKAQRSIIFIALGLLLLFYALGIFKAALHLLIIFVALGLIFYGFILGDFLPMIKDLLRRKK